MFQENWRKHAPLKSCLIGQRQMLSLIEKEIAASAGDLRMDRENWVQMWVDTGHLVTSDDGQLSAFRGIDFDGTLMWLVRHPNKRHGYHSRQMDPFAAMEEAKSAWADRRRVKGRWTQVKRLAWDLLLGRKSFTVTRDDAYRSALCDAGVDAFMSRIGMPKAQSMSGRAAALLMMVDPQLGFVIYAAYERTLSEVRATERATPTTGVAQDAI